MHSDEFCGVDNAARHPIQETTRRSPQIVPTVGIGHCILEAMTILVAMTRTDRNSRVWDAPGKPDPQGGCSSQAGSSQSKCEC